MDDSQRDDAILSLQRETAALRHLLDFYVSATPFLATNYYPPGRIVGAKKQETVVDGQVVSTQMVGGTVAPRSLASDLADTLAECEEIRAGRV